MLQSDTVLLQKPFSLKKILEAVQQLNVGVQKLRVVTAQYSRSSVPLDCAPLQWRAMTDRLKSSSQ